ncbi:MAG: sulfite exporter TauE/SafE family protein [Planctomycetes bacterium]|nr:sulfite exporter TauE/SafE family protein [Planctomycetota bacterium]
MRPPPLDALELLALLAAALGSALHGAGMCGGFAAAACLGRGAGARASAASLLYHAGKLTSYLFAGALAGTAGAALARAGSLPARALAVAAGALLAAAGVQALAQAAGAAGAARPAGAGAAAGTGGAARRLATSAWTGLGSGLLSLRTPLAPLYLGVFSGLLPCPLVYAFAARAAASGSFAGSLAVMAALALGTVPALLAAALGARLLPPVLRARAQGVAGVLLLALAAWTAWRGWAGAGCCM